MKPIFFRCETGDDCMKKCLQIIFSSTNCPIIISCFWFDVHRQLSTLCWYFVQFFLLVLRAKWAYGDFLRWDFNTKIRLRLFYIWYMHKNNISANKNENLSWSLAPILFFVCFASEKKIIIKVLRIANHLKFGSKWKWINSAMRQHSLSVCIVFEQFLFLSFFFVLFK